MSVVSKAPMLHEAIVLVGGLGRRLRPVVSAVPKPLAPVAGRPFLCWLLDGLSRQGVQTVILAIGYMGDKIRDTLGTEYNGVTLKYVYEESPLGTGGALWSALGSCSEERVFAMNGDTWLGMNLQLLANASPQADIVIAVRHAKVRSRYGALALDGDRVAGLREDGTRCAESVIINAGVYAIHTDMPKRFPMPEKFSLETDIFGKASRFDIRACITDAAFLDIGTPEDFALAQTLIPEWAG